MNNAEITALKKIMGLQTGKVYEDAKTLRYGHIMIMTDQDHDGSHIKGLLINFIHHFWPRPAGPPLLLSQLQMHSVPIPPPPPLPSQHVLERASVLSLLVGALPTQ